MFLILEFRASPGNSSFWWANSNIGFLTDCWIGVKRTTTLGSEQHPLARSVCVPWCFFASPSGGEISSSQQSHSRKLHGRIRCTELGPRCGNVPHLGRPCATFGAMSKVPTFRASGVPVVHRCGGLRVYLMASHFLKRDCVIHWERSATETTFIYKAPSDGA